jgi:hypothetical protein
VGEELPPHFVRRFREHHFDALPVGLADKGLRVFAAVESRNGTAPKSMINTRWVPEIRSRTENRSTLPRDNVQDLSHFRD